MKSKRLHYGWVICFCGVLTMFVGTGLPGNVFSGFYPYLVESGYTNTQVSALSTIRFLASLGAMFFVVQYMRLLGIRLALMVGTLCAAVGYAAFAIGDSYAACCIGMSLFGFADCLAGIVPLSILINTWFKKNKGLALGLVLAGSGLATICTPNLQVWLVEAYSLKTAFWVEGIVVLAASLLIGALVRSTPEKMGLTAYGCEEAQSGKQSNLRPLESGGLHGKLLLWMCIAMVPLGTVGTSAFTNLQLLYTTNGVDAAQAGFYFTVSGLFLTLGKTLIGKFADQFGVYSTSLVFFGLLCAGFVLCCLAPFTGSAVACAAMALVGFGIGVSTTGLSTIVATVTTEHDYPWVFRKIQIVYKLGSLGFSVLPGILADATGSYVPSYYMYVVFTVISAGMMLAVYRKVCSQAADSKKI